MKLLYAIAFALFPLAAPAQTFDSSLLIALCHDDYFEDTAGRCSSISADEGITVEPILEKYGAIIARDTDDEIAIFYLTDSEDVSVGSIQPQHESPTEEYAISKGDDSTAHATIEQRTIAAEITEPQDVPVGSIQPPHESPTEEYAILNDDDSTADATIEQSTIAAQIITTSPARDEAVLDTDEVEATGPTTAHIPDSAIGPVDENRTVE